MPLRGREIEGKGDYWRQKKNCGIPFHPTHFRAFLKVLTLKAEIIIIISNKLICLKRF